MRYAVLILILAAVAVPTSLAGFGAGTVDPVAAGPDTGLRYAERIQTPDGWQETTRIVTVGDPAPVRDARGLERDGVPVTVQRRADGDVLAAQRCWASADAPTSIQREPLTPSSLETSFERAWRLAGDDLPDAFDRGEPAWPNGTTKALFEAGPCPARGPGTTLDLDRPGSVPVDALLPAGLPIPPEADLQGETSLDLGTFHGRSARWVNASFDLGLPGPLPTAGGDQAPGPLLVQGRVATLWADGLPGPARRSVDLSLQAPHAPAYDRELVWEVELTGHEAGQTGELGPAPGPPAPLETVPWTDRGPSSEGHDVSFPLREAVAALEEEGVRYRAYHARYPDAYVRSATYEAGASPVPGHDVPGPGSVRAPAWTVAFTTASGEAYQGTVMETGSDDLASQGGPADGASTATPGPNRSSRSIVWESPAHGSSPDDAPGPDLDRLRPIAAGDEVRAAVDRLGFPSGALDRLAFEVHVPRAGAGFQVTVDLAATYRAPTGTVPETVQALVDGETGRVLAVSESSPEGEGSGLPDPVPATFADGEASGGDDAAVPLPDGPGAGVGLAAGAGLLGLLVGLEWLLSPLFSRIRRDEVLENPTRRELLEAIEEDPGVHLSDLIDVAGVGNGATRHHLGTLADANLVQVVEHGGYVRYFPAGEFTEAEARQRAVLRSGSNREVYEAYQDDPEQSIREVARRLDMSSSGVHRAVEKLREVDLIDG